MLHNTTKPSKRLKSDTKYPWNPKLYIFTNISKENNTTKNMLAISEMKKKQEMITIWATLQNETDLCLKLYGKRWIYMKYCYMNLEKEVI